jgi:ERCC4-type nuclease
MKNSFADNNDSITIIADDRERKGEVIASLKDMKGITVLIQRLSIGDYQADNRLVFERKTLHDFAISIIDGRLFNQMLRLANSTLKGVLVLEGTGKDLAETGMRREALQGALITTNLILGIPVLRSKDPLETAKLMIYSTHQIRSVSRNALQRPGYQPKNKRKRQLFILQGLPGIGRERAIKLLDRFGSVERVITANREELESVDGIGKDTAEKIKWAVSEQITIYGFDSDYLI